MTDDGRVFIPQVPQRFDKTSGEMMPAADTSAAGKYGKVLVMLPPAAYRLNVNNQIDMLTRKMATYNENDCIVALGSPLLIGVATYIAITKCRGRLRMLSWDKQTSDYLMIDTMVRVKV